MAAAGLMRFPIFIAVAAVALLPVLSGCERIVSRNPVPVTNLGLKVDSRTGAVMVRRGDTVGNIAARYKLNIRDIIEYNRLQPPYHLREDQRLLLPAPAEHKVGRNDTLLRLSHMYDVSISEMARLNELSSPYVLQVGQRLRLPSSLSEPVQSTAAVALRQSERTPLPLPLTRSAAAKNQPQPKSEPIKGWSRLSLNPLNGDRGDFTWPVKGQVLSKYGPKSGGLYNDGINIAAAKGTAVNAAAGGTVVYVGSDLKSYGTMVLIRHAGGFVTAYSHLGAATIGRGAIVVKGQKIGTVGSTGTVAQPQLHFEIRKGSQTYDPARFLGG